MGYILVNKNGSTKKVTKLPSNAVLINKNHHIYETGRFQNAGNTSFTVMLEKDGIVVIRDLLVFKGVLFPDCYSLVTGIKDVEQLSRTAYRVVNGKRVMSKKAKGQSELDQEQDQEEDSDDELLEDGNDASSTNSRSEDDEEEEDVEEEVDDMTENDNSSEEEEESEGDLEDVSEVHDDDEDDEEEDEDEDDDMDESEDDLSDYDNDEETSDYYE